MPRRMCCALAPPVPPAAVGHREHRRPHARRQADGVVVAHAAAGQIQQGQPVRQVRQLRQLVAVDVQLGQAGQRREPRAAEALARRARQRQRLLWEGQARQAAKQRTMVLGMCCRGGFPECLLQAMCKLFKLGSRAGPPAWCSQTLIFIRSWEKPYTVQARSPDLLASARLSNPP